MPPIPTIAFIAITYYHYNHDRSVCSCRSNSRLAIVDCCCGCCFCSCSGRCCCYFIPTRLLLHSPVLHPLLACLWLHLHHSLPLVGNCCHGVGKGRTGPTSAPQCREYLLSWPIVTTKTTKSQHDRKATKVRFWTLVKLAVQARTRLVTVAMGLERVVLGLQVLPSAENICLTFRGFASRFCHFRCFFVFFACPLQSPCPTVQLTPCLSYYFLSTNPGLVALGGPRVRMIQDQLISSLELAI